MSKKTLIVTLLAALIVLPAFADVENVKVGGELRFRAYTRNGLDLQEGHDQDDWMEQRTRLYLSTDLTENVFTYIRIQNDRVWGTATGNATDLDDMDVDRAYITLRDMLNTMGLSSTKVDLTLGRQPFTYGKSLILDTTRDALKTVIDLDPLTVDVFWWKLDEQRINVQGNDDQDLYGVYGIYSGIENWSIEPYYLFRKNRDEGTTTATDVSENRSVFGLRVSGDVNSDLNVWAETVYQDGDDAGLDVAAFGAWTGLTYTFNENQYKPWVNFEYFYGSGDKDATDKDDKAFDSMYRDHAFGELFLPTVLDNIHIFNFGAGLQLTEDVTFSGEYYHYREVYEEDGFNSGNITAVDNATENCLGNEVDLYLTYQYTADVATSLYWAYFNPGNAFDDPADDAAFAVRGQMEILF